MDLEGKALLFIMDKIENIPTKILINTTFFKTCPLKMPFLSTDSLVSFLLGISPRNLEGIKSLRPPKQSVLKTLMLISFYHHTTHNMSLVEVNQAI